MLHVLGECTVCFIEKKEKKSQLDTANILGYNMDNEKKKSFPEKNEVKGLSTPTTL